ncbi:winged helix-turn-helix transcriptional regulator [Microbacterium sp. No. 7]|uniref:winged helix-turn-helix transcriptional regulator n=1 Tax=Microbacterium sp. No. 7 TaxID=1714373 RepID=UPI0009E9BDBE|nr:helix-turn-helix domain-containing protein [Microbacterium sp. No. 7]
MPRPSPTLAQALENPCAIVRSLGVLTDTWSFLLVREALLGARTFAQFRDALGIASDVLSARLASLVAHGVMAKTPYREPGQRTRDAYELTPAGEELKTVLVAMQQWGHAHVPQDPELRVVPVTADRQVRVHAELVDADGRAVAPEDVRFVRVPRATPRARTAPATALRDRPPRPPAP